VTILGQFLAYMMVGICLNVLLTYLYRRGSLHPQGFRLVMTIANIVLLYIGLVVMGIPYQSPFAGILAVIGGISLGLQGANVIIRIGRLEARQRQKASTEE
jgi:amino acid transporter